MTSLAERRKSRHRRAVDLAAFVTNRGRIPAQTVCETFGISRGLLVSLLNEILVCCAGPWSSCDYVSVSALIDRESVSITDGDWLRLPLDLSAGEALSLKMMLRSVSEQPDENFTTAAESLQAKIADFLVSVPGAPRTAAPALRRCEIIRRAMREHRVLKIVYYSRSIDHVTERMVEPLELVDVGGIRCMAAYCRYRHSETLFALARMREVKLTDETFQQRELTDDRPLMTIKMWPQEGLISCINVTFDRKRASWAGEQFAGARLKELDDGGLHCVFEVEDINWTADIIAGFNAHASVEGPKQYSDWFHGSLSAIEDMYLTGRGPQ